MRKLIALFVGILVMGSASVAAAQEGGPNMFADITLHAEFRPDPTLGYGIAGGNRDASNLGSSEHGPCVGRISSKPDHAVTLEAEFSYLRFQAFANSHTSLVIRGPDGSYLCNVGTEGQHPQIEGAFAAGEYQVFIGVVDGGNPEYRLEITRNHPDGSSAPSEADASGVDASEADLTRTMILGAMRRIRSDARECVENSNPEKIYGQVEVQVKVQRDGQVGSALAQGRFAGTTLGTCIERSVLNVRFPGPLSSPQTFTYPFPNPDPEEELPAWLR